MGRGEGRGAEGVNPRTSNNTERPGAWEVVPGTCGAGSALGTASRFGTSQSPQLPPFRTPSSWGQGEPRADRRLKWEPARKPGGQGSSPPTSLPSATLSHP